MDISSAQAAATGELVDLIASKVGSKGRAVHPETAIASAARLAGSMLFRSFGFMTEGVEPGTVMLSNEANEKWPLLTEIVCEFLSSAGVSFAKSSSTAARGAEPTLTTLQSLSLLQDDAMRISKRHGLSSEEFVRCTALATAFIVKECVGSIGAEVGFNVAMIGFIEGSKTVPPALGATHAAVRKAWYKPW
ncbi:hypothetical protein [Stenotrophomonas panacihumi]|uniref:hypothetical protein n=1 Tax=Stenotrophomonas panacihumi TaxID=676599 RepID=UPI0011B1EA34|nr:hypothetical protein [Stenotrophomonas panacihumi]